MNAVTHGLTARSVLLPGEDAAEFAVRRGEVIAGFQPRNPAELTVVDCLAGDIWIADRSARAAGTRLAFRLRHEPREQATKERVEAIELGDRLLWQPSFPLPISRRFEIGELTEPPGSRCQPSPATCATATATRADARRLRLASIAGVTSGTPQRRPFVGVGGCIPHGTAHG